MAIFIIKLSGNSEEIIAMLFKPVCSKYLPECMRTYSQIPDLFGYLNNPQMGLSQEIDWRGHKTSHQSSLLTMGHNSISPSIFRKTRWRIAEQHLRRGYESHPLELVGFWILLYYLKRNSCLLFYEADWPKASCPFAPAQKFRCKTNQLEQ
jgi:hypothetical protein